MANLPEPVFFDTDAATIIDELVNDYETLTGFKLAPAQAERLFIQAIGFRYQLKLIQADEACRQNLLAYARYPMIDYLGELVGVERLPAAKSETVLRFNLVPGHPNLILPPSIRVRSIDGKVIFQTLEQKNVLATDEFVEVRAECTTDGGSGNGYLPDQINIILDPQAYVLSAANTTTTALGADQESDDGLRERIRLAPSSFSTAGPDDAYVFHAKSASSTIVSVGIHSPDKSGTVNVYPLVEGGGLTPVEVIEAVKTKLNNKKVRPLTDDVVVLSPGVLNYEIVVNLTLLNGADETLAVKTVTDNLTAYANARKITLGMDAVVGQIRAKSIIDNIYDADVLSPEADVIVGKNNTAVCTNISVNVIGYSDE